MCECRDLRVPAGALGALSLFLTVCQHLLGCCFLSLHAVGRSKLWGSSGCAVTQVECFTGWRRDKPGLRLLSRFPFWSTPASPAVQPVPLETALHEAALWESWLRWRCCPSASACSLLWFWPAQQCCTVPELQCKEHDSYQIMLSPGEGGSGEILVVAFWNSFYCSEQSWIPLGSTRQLLSEKTT